MKHNKPFSVNPLSAVIIGVALFPSTLMAAPQAGHVLAASGSIKAIGSDGKTRELNRRSPVYSGDRLVTSRSANAQVKFTDGAIVALKPSTELSVDEYSYEEGGLQKAFMSLVKGGFRTLTGAIGKSSQADYRVTTPVATIGIRGTLYDADYQPELGLELSAWSGGIRACNDNGCVNLGSDSDFRFGRIAPDRSFSGRDRSGNPSGRSGGDDQPGEDDEEGTDSGDQSTSGDTPVPGTDVNANVSNETGGSTTPDPTPTPSPEEILPTRSGFPLTGYAVAGTSNGGNPWGLKPYVMSLDYARLVELPYGEDEYFFAGTGSPLGSGEYLVSGWQQCSDCSDEPMPGMPYVVPVGDSTVYWSWWDATKDWSEFSVSNNPDLASEDGVFNPGLFVVGDFASPEIVGQLTGTVEFMSVLGEGFRNGNPAASAYGGGDLSVNLANQQVDGYLWFVPDDVSGGYEYWNLLFNGQVNSSGFKLGLTPWSQASESGSHMTRWQSGDYMDYEDVGLLGNVEGRFVGTTQVDGLVGAFDVSTDESTPQTLAGVFGMERTTPIVPYDPYRASYPVYGYMASSPGTTPNPWSERILPLDYGVFTQYTGGEFPMWAMQAWGGTLASGSQVVSGLDCSTESCKATLMPMVWESNPGNADNTTVYWGDWKGNYDYMYGGTSDLSVTDDFLPSADGVYNPGMYIFGTYASPAVVSHLVGSTDFYLSNAMMSIDGGQPSQAAGSGMMTVDLNMGTVSGAMQLENPYVAETETWSLAFSGTASTNGLDLSLESVGSFVDRGTGGVIGIDTGTSSMQAGFVGATDVHGVIGSFDANTQDTSPVNAQGVFLYQIDTGI